MTDGSQFTYSALACQFRNLVELVLRLFPMYYAKGFEAERLNKKQSS